MASDAELIGWSLVGDREAFVGVVLRHEKAIARTSRAERAPGSRKTS